MKSIVQAALRRLVDDQRVVLVQQPVVRDLGQQDAVGHQLDEGLVAEGRWVVFPEPVSPATITTWWSGSRLEGRPSAG
jgi:hypothetical protein